MMLIADIAAADARSTRFRSECTSIVKVKVIGPYISLAKSPVTYNGVDWTSASAVVMLTCLSGRFLSRDTNTSLSSRLDHLQKFKFFA